MTTDRGDDVDRDDDVHTDPVEHLPPNSDSDHWAALRNNMGERLLEDRARALNLYLKVIVFLGVAVLAIGAIIIGSGGLSQFSYTVTSNRHLDEIKLNSEKSEKILRDMESANKTRKEKERELDGLPGLPDENASPGQLQDHLQTFQDQLQTLDLRNYRRLEERYGILREGDRQEERFSWNSSNSSETVVFFAICDNQCFDLDIVLLNKDEEEVAQDILPDDLPIVEYTPRSEPEGYDYVYAARVEYVYTARVEMFSCKNDNGCDWLLQAYVKKE